MTRAALIPTLAILPLLLSALPLSATETIALRSSRLFLTATGSRPLGGEGSNVAQASPPQPGGEPSRPPGPSGLGHGPVVPQGPYNASPGTPAAPATPSMIYWCLNEKTWLYEPCKPPEPTFKPPTWKEQVPKGDDKPKH